MCLRRRGAVAGPLVRGSSSIMSPVLDCPVGRSSTASHASLACAVVSTAGHRTVTRVEYPARRKGRVHLSGEATWLGHRRLRADQFAAISSGSSPSRSPRWRSSSRRRSGRSFRAAPPRPRRTPGAAGSPAPSGVAVQPSPAASPAASQPVPEPTPVLVPAPMTGVLVSPEAAAQHPIAVMVDDQFYARPQSGFNAASVVWHAPAEGGIPRYMLIFQDEIPTDVGPVRSARQYYIEWAAEWNAMYVHAGGSPQAIRDARTRRATASGSTTPTSSAGARSRELRRHRSCYLWRATDRFRRTTSTRTGSTSGGSPKRVGADDAPMEPAWTFGPDTAPELRPDGGADPGDLPVRDDHLSLRRGDEQLPPLHRRRQEAPGRPRRRPGRRAEERRHPADGLRRRSATASRTRPPRGAQHRQGCGLDLDRRRHGQGRVAQEVGDGADAAVRAGRRADHPDRRPDVRPGHPRPTYTFRISDGAAADGAIAPRLLGLLGR